MPQPAIATPVCPVGTYTERRPRSRAARSSSSVTTFFPITVSEPTLCTTCTLSGRLYGPCGTLRSGGAWRRSRSCAPWRSAASRSSGSSFSWVWRPASSDTPASSAASSVGRQAGSSFPPGGATPINSVSGSSSRASSSVATIGTGLRQNGSTSLAVRPAQVESITATTSRVP